MSPAAPAPAQPPPPPLLALRDLSVTFHARGGPVHALDRVRLDLAAGEVLGLVGESGSGKSVTALALLGLLGGDARVTGGTALLDGTDLLRLSPAERARRRGADLAIVFQEPRAALDPIRPVGLQLADVIARHDPGPPAGIRARMLAALRRVRLDDPPRRARAYPSELSGGQCQRVAIAQALACNPRLLIADEATTGLDVTTQAAVMDLIGEAARDGAGVLLVTHDLALAAQRCHRIAVMHAGQVVEVAPAATLLARPRHPYTAGLLASLPAAAPSLAALRPIPGEPPDLRRADLPPCRFAGRCPRRLPRCDEPGLALAPVAADHLLACRNPP